MKRPRKSIEWLWLKLSGEKHSRCSSVSSLLPPIGILQVLCGNVLKMSECFQEWTQWLLSGPLVPLGTHPKGGSPL